MVKPKGSVRSSQLITTYGVGSIVALRDESFMVAGVDRWPVDQPDLFEPRLQRILGVRGFVRPPVGGSGADVPVVRFPRFYFCPECHRLAPYGLFAGSWQEASCSACDSPIVPARFVMACRRGHIDDFPWFRWVHAGSQGQAAKHHELFIQAGGTTSSLADVVVSCSCGESRDLGGAFGKKALKGIARCTGLRPWLTSTPAQDCTETPQALQRGASNVWFSLVRSVISIPPWSEGAYKALDSQWKTLRHIDHEPTLRGVIVGLGLTTKWGLSEDELVEAVKTRRRQEAGEVEIGDVKAQEHEALIRGKADNGAARQDFVCEPVADVGIGVSTCFSLVSNVTRLREVRALEGFTRLYPPESSEPSEYRVSILDSEKALLPAMEVIGEGVFLEFERQRLSAWESRANVVARAAVVQKKYEDRCFRIGVAPSRAVTPRMLLVHTFAHALITQWSLDSGYSASALRERIYVGDESAGALIYTATSDSAGSLGGVISQTRPERLLPGLLDAVRRSSWCSADPLCIEAGSQGADALNLGACHACVLLPETSCEEMNVFLDRGMMTGIPEDPTLGYFEGWMENPWPE
jgi:Domain of unknown function (DUF1998)